MKVYVTGGWEFYKEISVITKRIATMCNVQITSDWTQRIENDVSKHHLERSSKINIDQISLSDVVIAIMTDEHSSYSETFTEIGCAIGQGKKVIIVCNIGSDILEIDPPIYNYSHKCGYNIFFYHPNILNVPTLEKAEEWLFNNIVIY